MRSRILSRSIGNKNFRRRGRTLFHRRYKNKYNYKKRRAIKHYIRRRLFYKRKNNSNKKILTNDELNKDLDNYFNKRENKENPNESVEMKEVDKK